MNFCDQENLKLDYINGLLSGRIRKRFQRHLDGCASCSREMGELTTLVDRLEKIPRPEAEAASASRLFDSIRDSGTARSGPGKIPKKPSFFWLYVLNLSVVLSALVLLLVVLPVEGIGLRDSPRLSDPVLNIKEFLGLIVSISSLALIPSIVENLYLLMRRKWIS